MNKFEIIPIGAVQHSPYNPRRQPTAKDAKVIELANSIESVGLIQPISVRKAGLNAKVAGSQIYQIIAGARRLEAAKLAGMIEIAAMVHDLSVDDALKITVTENLQRQDLTPLEEGRGIASLLESGRTTAEIAADIAKSETWVRRRAKLAEVIQQFQELAITEYADWSAAHWELIAHLPPDTQEQMIKQVSPDDSLPGLKGKLRHFTNYLHHAIFPQTACAKCDKRSDREADLFAGMDQSWDTENCGKARCLDKQCWRQKELEFITKTSKTIAKKTGLHPVLVSVENNGDEDTGIKDEFEIEQVVEGTKGAIPAMHVDGEEAGKLIWIAPERKTAGKTEKQEPVITIEQHRLAHQVNAVTEWIQRFDKCPACMSDPMRMLAAMVCLVEHYGEKDPEKSRELFCLYSQPYDHSREGLLDAAWLSVKGKILQTLPNVVNPQWIQTEEECHALTLVIEILGLEIQEFIDEAEKAFPDEKKPIKKTKKGAKK